MFILESILALIHEDSVYMTLLECNASGFLLCTVLQGLRFLRMLLHSMLACSFAW